MDRVNSKHSREFHQVFEESQMPEGRAILGFTDTSTSARLTALLQAFYITMMATDIKEKKITI